MRNFAAAVFLSLSVHSYCLAWGTEGHQIVGKIATQYLTESTKREVTALLADDLNLFYSVGRPEIAAD